jgi:AraC-like DNA-binding protein
MTDRPEYLTDAPDWRATTSMDPLSEMLRSVRLVGGIFLDARFSAPWSVLAQIEAADCRPFLTDPTVLIGYHVVIAGEAIVAVEGQPPVTVGAGEIVLLPRNEAHTLGSGRDLRPTPASELLLPSAGGGLARIVHGGGGAETHLVCGFLGTDDRFNPLIATLPALLKLDVRQGMSRAWIETSVQFAAAELTEGRFNPPDVMSRLSELLFVEAVRNYAATVDGRAAGWLRGLSDPQVGRALALIHHRIDAPWSAEGLAREVGMSRSSFVERFAGLVGMPPIRYVTTWRLETARQLLRDTRQSIQRLANAVGYESEEAFSRAFKRQFGLPPARWRDRPQT